MNSIKRVFDTIQRQEVDHTPVIAVLSAYGARLSNQKVADIFLNDEAYLKAHAAVLERFPVDAALAPFDYSVIAEAFGSTLRFYDDQPPNLTRPAVKSWQELLQITYPDPNSTARLPLHLKTVKKLVKCYGEEKPVFAGIPGPCSLPALIMGMEAWFETLLFDEPGAEKVIEYCSIFWRRWAEHLSECGISGLIVTEGLAPAEITGRKLFSERVLPVLTRSFNEISTPKVFHPTGGSRINEILDLVKDLHGVIGIALGHRDDLAEARRLVGPEKLLLGNIDSLFFTTASAEQIYQKSSAILETMHGQGPFILANSGADIPLNTPPENIMAMCQAAIDRK